MRSVAKISKRMDADEINYRLRKVGYSQADLAKELAVSSAVISNTIHGRITSYNVAQRISGLLEMEIGQIWPDRYCFKPRPRLRAA